MDRRTTQRPTRGQLRVWCATGLTAVLLLGLEVALAAMVRTQGASVLAPGPASLDEVMGAVAAAVALLVGTWLATSSTAAVLAHAPGRLGAAADRLAAAWAPLLTRRVAAALVGASVAAAAAPATALADEAVVPAFPGFSVSAPVAASRAMGSTPSAEAVPPAGWTPSRPVQRPVASPELVTSGTAPTRSREVVVHRGDTLWGLVSAHLGPEATDTEIAEAWPRWHATNHDVIGDDPDRLLPGQVLRVPTPAVAR